MLYQYTVERTVEGQKVTETREIDVHEGMIIHGQPCDDEKELRRLLKLPLTKKLVYYKRTRYPGWEKSDISEVIIEELFSDWFGLKLDNGIRIHSLFLADMQKPNFAELMEQAVDVNFGGPVDSWFR